MYLFPEETFKKLRDREAYEKSFTFLDRDMKNILYNKKMEPTQKWLMYSSKLQQFLNLRNRMSQQSKQHIGSSSSSSSKMKTQSTDTVGLPQKIIARRNAGVQAYPDTMEAGVQIEPKRKTQGTNTTIFPMRGKETQTEPTVTMEMGTDTHDLPANEDVFIKIEPDDYEDNAHYVSAMAEGSQLMDVGSPKVVERQAGDYVTVTVFNNDKFDVLAEDEHDFREYAAKFYAKNKESTHIRYEDFEKWLRALRKQQSELEHSTPETLMRKVATAPRLRSNAASTIPTTSNLLMPPTTLPHPPLHSSTPRTTRALPAPTQLTKFYRTVKSAATTTTRPGPASSKTRRPSPTQGGSGCSKIKWTHLP